MHILISWFDPRFDMEEKNTLQVRENGQNFQFHQYAYEGIDRHVLLCMEIGAYAKEKTVDTLVMQQARALVKRIHEKFSAHVVEIKPVVIKDPIDLVEVKAQTEKYLLEHKEEKITIFLNPGYQMCQLSWYLCHTQMELNTHLVQLRQGQFTASGKPEKEEVKNFHSTVNPQGLMRISDVRAKKQQKDEILLTESFQQVHNLAASVAQYTDIPVLVLGESGAGKEVLVENLVENSLGRSGIYRVNCAAYSDELLSSELFGHVKGAFTGANAERKGLFEAANGGTLFMDEIGDISPRMQQSLLRILQDGTYQRLGENKMQQVDVRLIFATNRDLLQDCLEKRFRLDLYYRISAIKLKLPAWHALPLVEREAYIRHFAKINGQGERPLQFTEDARNFLIQYHMPGNLRQLSMLVKTLSAFYGNQPAITLQMVETELADEIRVLQPKEEGLTNWQDVEKQLIARVMKLCGGNKQKALKMLGYGSINTLVNKLKEYKIVAT